MLPVAETGAKNPSQVDSSSQSYADQIRYMTRLPILEEGGAVHGYELLFHQRPEGKAVEGDVQASRTILDDLVLFGLDKLTGGLPAFVHCSLEALCEKFVAVLPPAWTVLEIPYSLPISPKLLGVCRELHKAGFRFGLLDYAADHAVHPLLELAHYVKIDFPKSTAEERARLRDLLKEGGASKIACNIDTLDMYRHAHGEGFKLFQGFYFANPQLIQGSKVPANRALHVQILRQLMSDPLDLKTLAPLVMRDTALVYRVLRLVNSPLFAVRQPVSSVEMAIMILGEKTFRRIATLAIQCEMNAGQSPELLNMALIRGRFCELAAAKSGLDPAEQYLLGLLSLLPAMLRVPMEQIVSELPLSDVMRRALLGEEIRERSLLNWIDHHERNLVSKCYEISGKYELNEASLHQFYVDALMWSVFGGGV